MEKILILGSKGMLGGELASVFGSGAVGWSRGYCDVTDIEDLKIKIGELKPSALINCVAYNDVDGAENNKEAAFKLNSEVVKNLSEITNDLDIPLIHFSTNYVFDGVAGEYKESDIPNPQSIYAQSKYQGEQNLLDICKNPYLIRTSVLFGPKGKSELSKKSFVELMLELGEKTDTIKAVNDEINSITYAKDLALAVKVLLSQKFAFGIYHFSNSGDASWYDFAKEIFKIKKMDIALIPVPSSEFPRVARRPKKSVLLNTKFIEFRPWQEALREYLNYEL